MHKCFMKASKYYGSCPIIVPIFPTENQSTFSAGTIENENSFLFDLFKKKNCSNENRSWLELLKLLKYRQNVEFTLVMRG